jgi:hypothetical protein
MADGEQGRVVMSEIYLIHDGGTGLRWLGAGGAERAPGNWM